LPITVGTLGALRGVSQQGPNVIFSFESSDLILTAILPDVLRHTWVPRHWRLYTQRTAETHAVHRRYWPAGPIASINETPQAVRVCVGNFIIEATRDPFHLRYSTTEGRPLLEEANEGGLSWSYWEYALRFQLAADDHFYGMGQANQLTDTIDLDHRGHLREVWNQHSPPAATIFPALLSLRGYGLLIDNPCKALWDLGDSDPQTFSYRAQGGGLEYYVFCGPHLGQLLHTFLTLTGLPQMPPRWVFGLLQSRYGYRNRDELETIARTFRQKRLPCDGLILDVFWFKEMGDLEFHAVDWPKPGQMITELKNQGFRIMVIEEPYITVKSRNYSEASNRGYLAKHYDGSPYTFDFWPGECGMVDFSNPAARAWWTEQHRPLLELGVAGWWADLNEPAKHFQDMLHHDGPAAAVHNVTALFMHQAIHEAHQRYAPERRVFILSRAASPGSQRYGAALWSGDVDMTFASLRKQVALGLNVGLAGIPIWGTDIGGFGFAGKCTPELYARWFEFGAFCPLCRPHGDQTALREPWQFGPEVEAICRKYLRLRYRLMPYLYTAAHDACSGGLPIMRPLVLDFPDDPRAYNLTDEYLFGRDILVAPVLEEGATERIVYLPAGAWVDFWTDTVYEGPRFLTVEAPLDVLPLFVRQGAIIPTGPDAQHTSESLLDPLTLEIYPGIAQSFTLYEDDGETTAYQTGGYVQTRFDVTPGAGAVTCLIGEPRGGFPGYQAERTLVLKFHQRYSVYEVRSDDLVVAPCVSAQLLERAACGWWWDEGKGILALKLPRTAEAVTVRVC
jgi:alpha-glucosidase